MVKKNQRKIFLGIILVVLLGIVLSQTGLLPLAVTTECSGGITVLGITNAQITTSEDLGGKEVIRVTAVANQGGECARIKFTADDLEEALSQGGEDYVVDEDVFGDLITNTQKQRFTVSQKSQLIYKVGFDEKQEGTLCSVSNCEKTYPDTIYTFRDSIGLGKCWCINKNLVGRGGDFDSTFNKEFDVTFKIEGMGTTTLTDSQQSGIIGTKAFIKWAGDLFSGSWLTVPNYDSYLRIADNRWRMTDSGFYDDISDRFEEDTEESISTNLKGCLIGGSKNIPGWFDTGWEIMEECVGQYNGFVDLKLTNRDNTFVNAEGSVGGINWVGNVMRANLDTFTTWQVFTIDLDAEWVGIHKKVGTPQVKCPDGRIDVGSGSQETVVLKVRDLSGTSPTFGLSLSCTDGTGNLQQVRVGNVGTTYQSVNGYVTITTTAAKLFSCQFEAYDVNNPTNRDSCNLNLKGIPFSGCVANTEKACSSDGKELGTCNSNGQSFSWVPCSFGCEAFENTYRCRLQTKEICNDGIDNDGDGLIDMEDSDCNEGFWNRIKNFFSDLFGGFFGLLTTLKMIVVFAISGISIFSTEGFLRKLSGLKGKSRKFARWIISIGIGVGIGFFLWQFIGSFWFWILVPLLIVYSFFSSQIKNIIPK